MAWKQALKPLAYAAGGLLLGTSGLVYLTPQHELERSLLMPAIHTFTDAEGAHRLAVWAAKRKWVREDVSKYPELRVECFGLRFDNPVGLAAGFDKNGEALPGLEMMGFGFVEIGSVTPRPQEGNPKPRVFRLLEDKAVINRYGFNSDGMIEVADNLKEYRFRDGAFPTSDYTHGDRMVNLGVNLGINKTSTDPPDDYMRGVSMLGRYADYIVINVSSPNTPGLRSLQATEPLKKILNAVNDEKLKQKLSAPLLLKIAPDLSNDDLESICDVIMDERSRVAGVILSNTTISRPDTLNSNNKSETGGLSGQPLKQMSTELIKTVYKYTQGKLPIVGVGGVATGQDAYDKIRAGASLVQLYTSLVYEGPSVVPQIKWELSELLERDGFSHVSEAVGADVREELEAVAADCTAELEAGALIVERN